MVFNVRLVEQILMKTKCALILRLIWKQLPLTQNIQLGVENNCFGVFIGVLSRIGAGGYRSRGI